MGAVYLTYSAYYVSINIAGMKLFIGVIHFARNLDIVHIEFVVLGAIYCGCEEYFGDSF